MEACGVTGRPKCCCLYNLALVRGTGEMATGLTGALDGDVGMLGGERAAGGGSAAWAAVCFLSGERYLSSLSAEWS